MTRKYQGEGDKDSVRRINDKETQFVTRRGDQDSRDADVMRDKAK